MKKKGMTLAEILITLVILGILSAVIIPAANHAKPNETKVAFLKNYDALTQTISEITSNSRIFPVCQGGFCFEDYPLLNTAEYNRNGLRFAQGNGKFCRVLAYQFDAQNPNCSDNDLAANARVARNNNWSFTTRTGESYRVLTRRGQVDLNGGEFISEILVDVNGTQKGDNCIYSDACQNPDTFRFWVTGDGEITAGDRAAEYYLRTRSNLKTKHIDVRDNNNNINPPEAFVESEFITRGGGDIDDDIIPNPNPPHSGQ